MFGSLSKLVSELVGAQTDDNTEQGSEAEAAQVKKLVGHSEPNSGTLSPPHDSVQDLLEETLDSDEQEIRVAYECMHELEGKYSQLKEEESQRLCAAGKDLQSCIQSSPERWKVEMIMDKLDENGDGYLNEDEARVLVSRLWDLPVAAIPSDHDTV